MKKKKKTDWNLPLPFTVIPVVLVLIITFFLLTSNSIISLSKKNMSLRSDNCASLLDTWTGKVMGELDIYKQIIEESSMNDEEIQKFLETTYETHDEYPMGIYIGDTDGVYLDASGWIPGDDWVMEERPWYITGKNSTHFVFGEPYPDSMLGKMCISASARMNYPDAVRVISTDIYLDYAQSLVTQISLDENIDGAFFVTGSDNLIIADSEKFVSGDTLEKGTDFYRQIDALLKDGKSGQEQLKCNNQTYYIYVTRMESTGWILVTYARRNLILKYLYKVELIMALVAIIVAVILIIITRHFSGRMNRMQMKSQTDKLTGILNREGFDEAVKEAMQRLPGQGALLIFDMDNFKSINDTLGHPEGDRALVKYAQFLDKFFNRKNDIVARIGGDEFAVFICSDIDMDCLNMLLRRFMQRMEEYFRIDYEEFHITSSIGAAFNGSSTAYNELYNLADEQLYEVKRTGKNRFSINPNKD